MSFLPVLPFHVVPRLASNTRLRFSPSARMILCCLLGAASFSVQAGVLPLPGKKALVGGVAVVAGAAAIQAAKKHCSIISDPATGQRRTQCDGVNVGGVAEKADETVDRAKAKLGTYKLRRALNLELGATGEPPNPKGCEAHHIVPRGENRIWARESAGLARAAIEGCVDIESAENGVYLPAKVQSQCYGRRHPGLHSRAYYDDLAERLSQAREDRGCSGVRRALSEIKTELASGTYP